MRPDYCLQTSEWPSQQCHIAPKPSLAHIWGNIEKTGARNEHYLSAGLHGSARFELKATNVTKREERRGRGLTAGQDGRHYVRLCLARGRLSVYCLIRRCWQVRAWRALLRGAPGLLLAARERRSDRSSREETRAGLLTVAPARAERRAGGRADVEARSSFWRCVAGRGAVQGAERAGGRGGPRPLPEVCDRVWNCAWGPLGDVVVSRPYNTLGYGGADAGSY
ncbi:hypothetical protein NDU88_000685 [Pleurodeles waltl]|uniref:Uncharacterized protein n=1 Tax=Pleurodeles waltl TaxID=8319 RepID=A0AAV7R6F6_PLEWA|nr:hypothetical protein NDU88_000685 [Pleurodeles waltl]